MQLENWKTEVRHIPITGKTLGHPHDKHWDTIWTRIDYAAETSEKPYPANLHGVTALPNTARAMSARLKRKLQVPVKCFGTDGFRTFLDI